MCDNNEYSSTLRYHAGGLHSSASDGEMRSMSLVQELLEDLASFTRVDPMNVDSCNFSMSFCLHGDH
jgi:hypothetical protein